MSNHFINTCAEVVCLFVQRYVSLCVKLITIYTMKIPAHTMKFHTTKENLFDVIPLDLDTDYAVIARGLP